MVYYNTLLRHARVAQRWSTSLPRRGSRVRSPSRASIMRKGHPFYGCPFSHNEPNSGLEVRSSRLPTRSLLLLRKGVHRTPAKSRASVF